MVPVGVATTMVGIYLSVVSPATCSDSSPDFADGTYVKSGTKIHIDAEATAVGVCQFWWQGAHYPQYDDTLAVMKIQGPYTFPNASQAPLYYFEPYPWVSQHYDTRSPNGGSSYTEVIPSVNGVYAVALQAFAANDCNNTSPTAFMNKSFNIVSCVPVFNIVDATGAIDHAPIDGTPITISRPVVADGGILESAIDSAIANWTSLLATYGVTVSFTKRTALCLPGETHCVTIKIQTPPTDPTACAETKTRPSQTPGSDGTWAFSADTSIPPGYVNWPDSPSFLKFTLNHEFGHFFGFKDQAASCSTADSVMTAARYPCGTTGLYPPGPTITDGLPMKTVYGLGPRTTCQ
jgi:hypothetical protein